MLFRLERTDRDDTGTRGVFRVELEGVEVFVAHSLELPWKDNERMVSCIPAGRYPCVRSYSPTFKRVLWEVKNVPNRTGIRIHAANFVRELRGCVALGMSRLDIDGDGGIDVGRSGEAMALFDRAVWPNGTATLEVIDPDGNLVASETEET